MSANDCFFSQNAVPGPEFEWILLSVISFLLHLFNFLRVDGMYSFEIFSVPSTFAYGTLRPVIKTSFQPSWRETHRATIISSFYKFICHAMQPDKSGTSGLIVVFYRKRSLHIRHHGCVSKKVIFYVKNYRKLGVFKHFTLFMRFGSMCWQLCPG